MALGSLTNTWSIDDINPRNLIRYYLRELDVYFVGRDGKPWGDDFFWWCLSQGLMHIEEKASVTVLPVRRVEFHDYHLKDNHTHLYLNLHKPPVYSVMKLSIVFPVNSQNPTGNGRGFLETSGGADGLSAGDDTLVYDIPPEWLRLHRSGQLQVVTHLGNLHQQFLADGGSYLPLLTQNRDYLPQMFRVEYIGGFHNAKVPMLVTDALFKTAAIEALTVLSDTLRPPGVKNFTLDFDKVKRSYQLDTGANDSVAAVFSARISQYKRDLYGLNNAASMQQRGGMIQQIHDRYQGLLMEVA